MKISPSLVLAVQALSVLARPSPKGAKATAVTTVAATTAAAVATATAVAGGAAKEEEEKDPNKVDQSGQFGAAINLTGGDIQTDVIYPPGVIGQLEIEFKNPDARVLRVTENTTPGNAPAGFTFAEPVSYKVELSGTPAGLTLSKVDYIRNAASTVDISKGQIGRLCAETKSFVVGAGVGELEFEDDENELTLTVDNMVGEWAIFLPTAATGGATAGGATISNNASRLQQLLDLILVSSGAASKAAGGK
ncbi:hypothetical protein B0T26DRAFT_760224 [Lasiosphaeria miniovina]|uniref:Accumulation-associated protein n=1 Tax=Lasiosphaeria miniovina TaxID=1954250 RepID=A0AA40BGE0_9PEZI|nr:uncharacterized protein B0T26DRAFT_760224 [Lasiosphaeria miniovina]KAK0733768.1 hypothetical protein B0T26DRAFT_760224 [Lasiosphaeria miniovina]